jgi:hypothetical protein
MASRMGNSAQAVARGLVVPFTGATGTHGGTASNTSSGHQRMTTGAAEQAQAGDVGHGNAEARAHQNAADTRQRESRLGAPSNALEASNSEQTGGAANMCEHGGNGNASEKPSALSALTIASCSEGWGARQNHIGQGGHSDAAASGAHQSAASARERGDGLSALSGNAPHTPKTSTTGGAGGTRERGGEAATGGQRVRERGYSPGKGMPNFLQRFLRRSSSSGVILASCRRRAI